MDEKPRHETLMPELMVPTLEADGDDSAWISVIRKMDEVYSDLLQYQVALEEKNTELENTQHFLTSVLDAMSDVLIVSDRYGRVVEVNRALTELLGKDESQLKGTQIADLFEDEASKKKASEFSNQLRDTPLHDCEVSLLGAQGEAVPVAFNCSPRHDNHDRLVGMVMVGRPIGELRKAYRALKEAHQELQTAQQQLIHSAKMASLGRLVAGVAHELNNPISFVLGNVHALGRYTSRLKSYLQQVHDGVDPAILAESRRQLRIDYILNDLNSLLEGVTEGAERTRDIVDDLKRFSVVDKEEPQEFNLVDVIERAIHWVTKASRSAFRVETDLPKTLPVVGTAAHIQQVIINLIQNAHDATENVENPCLFIAGKPLDDERIIVSFEDNGSGIPDDVLPNVFDPFFTTKDVGKGTGLGLSISYGIVERHNGQLLVDNGASGGARFTLILPTLPASDR